MLLDSLDPQIDRTGHWTPHNQLPLTLNQAHLALAKACRKNIATFGKFVFGYDIAPHHREWLKAALNPNHDKLIIVSPRESAKTTWMCQILLCWYIGHFPHRTNAILSVTEDQAIQRLIVIRDTIQNNPRYQLVFPWAKPDFNRTWTTTGINVWDMRPRNEGTEGWDYGQYKAWLSRSGESLRDHTLRAAGALSGQVIGNRYSGIVLIDDIHDEKNVNTREQIDKLDTWMHRQLLPCLRPGARTILIGTRWAPEDMIGRLSERKVEEVDKNNPSIVHTKKLWQVIETIALKEKKVGDKVELESYWPENWPIERLLAKKQEVGDVIFELMYQNNPFAMSGDLFKPEWLEKGLPIRLPTFKTVYIGVDLAFTKNNRSDNTAIITLGVTEDFRVYNLAMSVGRFDKNELAQEVQRAYLATEQYGAPCRILCEKVGAQAWIIDELISNTGLPIEGIPVTHGGDKVARAQPFSVVCAKGNYYCDWTTTNGRRHKGELLSFPTGPKDDTVDAVSIVMRVIGGASIMRPKVHIIKPKFMI